MINDTTPAVLSPSPQHRPNDRSSISIRCRARQTKRKRCSRGHRSKRDHDAFPDFAQWASRSEFEPVSSITHPSLLFPPDRLLFRPIRPTDWPGDIQRSSRPRAGARCDKGIHHPTHWHEGSERRFQVLQSHLFIFNRCIASLSGVAKHDATEVTRSQFEIAKTGFRSHDQSEEHMTVDQLGISRCRPNRSKSSLTSASDFGSCKGAFTFFLSRLPCVAILFSALESDEQGECVYYTQSRTLREGSEEPGVHIDILQSKVRDNWTKPIMNGRAVKCGTNLMTGIRVTWLEMSFEDYINIAGRDDFLQRHAIVFLQLSGPV